MKRRTFLLLSTVAATTLLIGRNQILGLSSVGFNSKLFIPPIINGEKIDGVYNYTTP